MDDDPSPVPVRPAGLDVRVSSRVGRLPLGRAQVAAIAATVLRGERCHSALLTVTFVSDRAMAHLHREHLGIAGPTDIITFQHAATVRGAPTVGDVYIAPNVARRNAREAGGSVREEMARLVIHGVLHTLGWEHPDGATRDGSAMWRRQERWLARWREEGEW